ncbi:MAG TPA: FtsW/RodA/SpoVE family cell cycle protein, partial [Clostridiales bacterium]|nr:FtsW/RodA/SpoVE family cell cycle protein [Clostridiales bacterium]
KEYAGERIVAWLEKDYEPLGARWQINQSLFAIGSGGLLGAGLGNSMQKHLYVSEPQNDFIFSIVSEELGFIGSTIILILFALLVWRGITIGIYAKDKFGALLAMGMVFQVGLQVILNVAVVTDTIPNTGIGLPFFSSGGTSLLILLAEMGVILSVSRFSRMGKITSNKENAKPERRRGKVS